MNAEGGQYALACRRGEGGVANRGDHGERVKENVR